MNIIQNVISGSGSVAVSGSNNSTATVISAITAYIRVNATTSAGTLINFSMPANNKLKYTGITTSKFHIMASASILYSNNNQITRLVFGKNGTMLSDTEVSFNGSTASQRINASINGIVSLAQNDILELYIRNTSATNNLTVEFFTMTANIINT